MSIENAAPPSPAEHAKTCANCGAPMYGPFCYACGQPEKGMIRHLASVLSDVADTIFNVDSRIFRSILPLYLRPGFLTVEYFEGRRTRYVTPFRLFFFLCVISFFAIQASLNLGDLRFNLGGDDKGIEHAQNEADLQKRTKKALDGIETAKSAPSMPESAKHSLDLAADAIRRKSEQRLEWIRARDEAVAKGAKAPPDPNDDDEDGTFSINGTPFDPTAHPLHVSWLPRFANAKLNEMAERAKDNTLFVLMPLFAVLLKIVYLFKRRLYMEHLMVALHSHAFIFMSLLLIALLALLRGWVVGVAPGAEWIVSLLRDAAWIWLISPGISAAGVGLLLR